MKKNGKVHTKDVRLSVKTNDSKGISGVNVYANARWLGTTDRTGSLQCCASSGLMLDDTLIAFKEGYRVLKKRIDTEIPTRIEMVMKEDHFTLDIESMPPAAILSVDGRHVGKTPFRGSVFFTGQGKVKIQLTKDGGFQPYEAYFPLSKNTLDLSGPRKIRLREDLISRAKAHIREGRKTKGVGLLKQIRKTDNQF